ASRRDLLPQVRIALSQAKSGSDLAGACLLALRWLRDTEPATVPFITPHLNLHKHLAINALLMNGSSAANYELAKEHLRRPDLQLAVILANDAQHRDTGIAAIERLAKNGFRFRFESGLATLVLNLRPELLPMVAAIPGVFALAEEVGYSPPESFRIVGEKPAALRIIGTMQPDAAVRIALARLRDPSTPDGELYVPIVTSFAGNPSSALWDILLQDPPPQVTQAIGHALGRLNS